MSKIQVATINDTEEIMFYIDKFWKKKHILSQNISFFLNEFQNNNNLNIIIAKNNTGTIVGMFGFLFYNSSETPDVAGSIWHVNPEHKELFLGIKLRNFMVKNITHRFFAAPGAGLQTRKIYTQLKMNWHKMDHFYIINDKLNEYTIGAIPNDKREVFSINNNSDKIKITRTNIISDISEFNFSKYSKYMPIKDLKYIEKKFYNNPIHKYDIYIVKIDNEIINIFICRAFSCDSSSAYRLVDFYGDENYMNTITQFLYQQLIENNYEYVDFISSGFNIQNILASGFRRLDFEGDIIIPNYTNPLVKENIPIYCVSDKTNNYILSQIWMNLN